MLIHPACHYPGLGGKDPVCYS